MSKYIQLEIPFDFEEFRDIEGYEGLYQVSNQGRVYSLITNKFLRLASDRKGYLLVGLHKNGKTKTCRVHRLVANAFIPNPLHLPQINHISEIKSENHVSNLEWCDNKYNSTYGTKLEKVSKKVLQFTKDNKFVAEYPSTREAARALGIGHKEISRCCNGREHYNSAGGFVWKFKSVG